MRRFPLIVLSAVFLSAFVLSLACRAGAENSDEAARQAEKKENLAMAKWEAQIELAHTYTDAGRIDEALAEYRKAVEYPLPDTLSTERRRDATRMLIQVHDDFATLQAEQKKDFDGAINTLKAALSLAEKLPTQDDETKELRIQICKRIAGYLREQGKPDAAIEFLKKAQEIQ